MLKRYWVNKILIIYKVLCFDFEFLLKSMEIFEIIYYFLKKNLWVIVIQYKKDKTLKIDIVPLDPSNSDTTDAILF